MEENRNEALLEQQETVETEPAAPAFDPAAAMERLRDELSRQLSAQMGTLLEEALRLRDMSQEERAVYEANRREGDLAARELALEEKERQLARRELRARAQELLAARGLPQALADAIGYDSPEGLTAAVNALEQAFRQAVQEAVKARLTGESPAAGASAQGLEDDELDDETYYRLQAAGR